MGLARNGSARILLFCGVMSVGVVQTGLPTVFVSSQNISAALTLLVAKTHMLLLSTHAGLCPLLWAECPLLLLQAVIPEVHCHLAAAVSLLSPSMRDFALTHTCPVAAVW